MSRREQGNFLACNEVHARGGGLGLVPMRWTAWAASVWTARSFASLQVSTPTIPPLQNTILRSFLRFLSGPCRTKEAYDIVLLSVVCSPLILRFLSGPCRTNEAYDTTLLPVCALHIFLFSMWSVSYRIKVDQLFP